MKIIALDQSTTATGVAIFNDGELVTYALIKPKSSKRAKELVREYDIDKHTYFLTMPEELYGITIMRSSYITDTLELIFDKEKPDMVYFEEVFENKNPKARNPKGTKSLARLQGFIAHLCYKQNIPYEIVEENKWITAWGKYSNRMKREERKADIMTKVNDLYNLNITINDISDAIGIGRYGVLQNEKEN